MRIPCESGLVIAVDDVVDGRRRTGPSRRFHQAGFYKIYFPQESLPGSDSEHTRSELSTFAAVLDSFSTTLTDLTRNTMK
jgi:hypothetical protein